jgi:hypothetical protein
MSKWYCGIQFNSIICWAIYGGIPFKFLYVQENTSLNFFRSSISWSKTTSSSAEFTFTYYIFSLVPKLFLVDCSSSITIQPTMVKSCTHFQTCVSLMIISPTSRWKKNLSRCCLTMSGGITRLIAKTHIGSTCCFGTSFVILRSGIWIGLETSSICRYFYGSYW